MGHQPRMRAREPMRPEPDRPGIVARADLLALLAVASWGLSYGLTKLAFREWRPLVFTGTRFLAMAGIALVVLAAQGRLRVILGADRARFALGGLFGFTLYQLGFTLGLDRTSALASTLLLTTVPLFSLLFLRLGGVESVGRSQWVGVSLATLGILLFMSGTSGGLAADRGATGRPPVAGSGSLLRPLRHREQAARPPAIRRRPSSPVPSSSAACRWCRSAWRT